jgi:hypothetical protein
MRAPVVKARIVNSLDVRGVDAVEQLLALLLGQIAVARLGRRRSDDRRRFVAVMPAQDRAQQLELGADGAVGLALAAPHRGVGAAIVLAHRSAELVTEAGLDLAPERIHADLFDAPASIRRLGRRRRDRATRSWAGRFSFARSHQR